MTTCHDQIKDKQPVAKFEQQTWYLVHYKPEFFLVNNCSHIVSECPRASWNGSLLGHIELTRRAIKRKSHFDQIFSKKKSARLCGYLPGDNQQHHTGSGNECHEWFLRLCKQERNFHQIRSNSSKILEGTTQKMIEKASHFGWNRSKTRKFRADRKNGQASIIYSGPVRGWRRGLGKFSQASLLNSLAYFTPKRFKFCINWGFRVTDYLPLH